jgi:integrase/recombinase XerD
MLGHASLSTTQFYTQVSVGQLKALHTALHPGRLPEAARRRLEAKPAATAEDLLAALRREATEDED